MKFFFTDYQAYPGLHRATFADGGPKIGRGANCGDEFPITSGNPPTTTGVSPGKTFQAAPRPGPDCDFTFANTPHRGGMLAGIADGSVRIISPAISPTTYWGAITPDRGEVLGNDW
jgi:hypothetical protein